MPTEERSFYVYPIVEVVSLLIAAFLLSGVVIFIDLKFFRLGIWATYALMGIWALIFAKIIYAVIQARFEKIVLEKKALAYEKGIFFHKRVVLPYVQITEARYTQNLLERILDIGEMFIDTAGGSKMAIVVKHMRMKHIRRILEEISKKSNVEVEE